MAYGIKVRTPKLQEFGDDDPCGLVGKVRAPFEAEIVFILRMSDGRIRGNSSSIDRHPVKK